MKVICVHSYKGGTGKTILAVNISLKLAQQGKRVLLIDSDFRAPSLAHFFLPAQPVPFYFSDFLNPTKEVQLEDTCVPSQAENLFLIYTNPNPRLGLEFLSLDSKWHARALKKFLDTIDDLNSLPKTKWDFIILDNTPGLDLPAINNLLVSDIALVVLQPNIYGVKGTHFLLRTIYSQTKALKKRTDYLILNQVPKNDPQKIIEKWKQEFIKEYDLKVLTEISCSCSVISSSLEENQYSLVQDKEFSEAISVLCQEILTE
ncbi:MAG: ParA family protein [Promethearchaeota archaeon]